MIELIVSPVGRGRYSAHLGDRCVVVSAREPFLAAARVLLREGVAPDTVLTMRHAGSSITALRSTVGAAAKLMVKEEGPGGCPVFVPWTPPPCIHGSSPIEFEDVA